MNATQLARAQNSADVAPVFFEPTVAALESAYLGQILAFWSFELWLSALETGIKREHDLVMALLGQAPEEHEAPWESLSRTSDNGWLAALDKGLAAAGE